MHYILCMQDPQVHTVKQCSEQLGIHWKLAPEVHTVKHWEQLQWKQDCCFFACVLRGERYRCRPLEHQLLSAILWFVYGTDISKWSKNQAPQKADHRWKNTATTWQVPWCEPSWQPGILWCLPPALGSLGTSLLHFSSLSESWIGTRVHLPQSPSRWSHGSFSASKWRWCAWWTSLEKAGGIPEHGIWHRF